MTTITRRPRRDSKLGSLPPEQRVRVDKWLFDKGLTYQQVAEACHTMFALKVTKSSVGRYYERTVQERMAAKQPAESAWPRLGEDGQPLSPEEGYQLVLRRMTDIALELAERCQEELNPRLTREFARLVRVLIASRREKNQQILVGVARARWEMKAALMVWKHLRKTSKAPFPRVPQPEGLAA